MGHRSVAPRGRTHGTRRANAKGESARPYDLKFVPIGNGKRRAGGWYRELPNHQLEVMTRGHLERVPLEDADPEEKAKAVVKDMLRRHH